MDITNINTQNAVNLYRTPEPRFAEATSKADLSAAAPKMDNSAPSDTEIGQKSGGNAENRIAEAKPDISQIEDMFSKAVNEANKKLESKSVEFQFSIHEKTGRVNVKIVNTDSKEVIREIPSQKSLDMLAKLWELAGIIVDDKK